MGTENGEAEFDALLAIQEVEGCYQTLTDAILPYAEQKKANYKIKDIKVEKVNTLRTIGKICLLYTSRCV